MKEKDQQNYTEKHIEITSIIQNLWEHIADVPLPESANYADLGTICIVASKLEEANHYLSEWIRLNRKEKSHGS